MPGKAGAIPGVLLQPVAIEVVGLRAAQAGGGDGRAQAVEVVVRVAPVAVDAVAAGLHVAVRIIREAQAVYAAAGAARRCSRRPNQPVSRPGGRLVIA